MMFLLFLISGEDETPEVNLQSGPNLPPLPDIMPAHGSCVGDWPSSPDETPVLVKVTRLSEVKEGNKLLRVDAQRPTWLTAVCTAPPAAVCDLIHLD